MARSMTEAPDNRKSYCSHAYRWRMLLPLMTCRPDLSHLLPASTLLFVGDFGDAEFVKGVSELTRHYRRYSRWRFNSGRGIDFNPRAAASFEIMSKSSGRCCQNAELASSFFRRVPPVYGQSLQSRATKRTPLSSCFALRPVTCLLKATSRRGSANRINFVALRIQCRRRRSKKANGESDTLPARTLIRRSRPL